MFKNKNVKIKHISVKGIDGNKVPVLVLEPAKAQTVKSAAVMWIHGGGYYSGMKEMAYITYAFSVTEMFGVTVFSPGYRLSVQKPFPAALHDCYSALLYIKNEADK